MSTVANPRRFQALIAVLLAMLLACVGGLDSTSSPLVAAIDHGSAGAALEHGGSDTIPTGKPISEGTAEEVRGGEGEREDSQPIVGLDPIQVEVGLLPVSWIAERDPESPPRSNLLVKRVGARGPPRA